MASVDGSLDDLQSLAPEQFCYLTTVGRKSGRPHTIEIWFAMQPGGSALYMLSGGGYESDWVKNILNDPNIEVRITSRKFRATGRIVDDPEEEGLARRLVVAKYYGRAQVGSSGWEAESLPVAVDLETEMQ